MDQRPQDIVVLYYSRSGHSERVARALAQALGGRLQCLSAPRHVGVLGFISAAISSLLQRKIAPPDGLEDLTRKSLVVLCGPVWTSYPAVPLRAVLRRGADLSERVALFLTCGSASSGREALKVAQNDFGRPFAAMGVLANSEEGTDAETNAIACFTSGLGATPNMVSPASRTAG